MRVIVKVSVPNASITDAVGALNWIVLSSSTIVTTLVVTAPRAMLTGLRMMKAKVSSPSTSLSARIATVTVRFVTPAAKVSVPLVLT